MPQTGSMRSSPLIDAAKAFSASGVLLSVAASVTHPVDDPTVVQVTFNALPEGEAFLSLYYGTALLHYDIKIFVGPSSWYIVESAALDSRDVKQLRYRLGIDGAMETPTAVGNIKLEAFVVADVASIVYPAGAVDRSWLNQVFGKSNIDQWADLDNTQNDGIISSRIAWAIATTEAEIRSMLERGPYAWADISTHPVVKQMVGIKAGLLLYTPRAVALEKDQANPLRGYEKLIKEMIQRVHSGNLKFGGVEATGSSAPFTGE